MAIVRCENGHFYDDRKHGECPYCNKIQNTFEDRTTWHEMEAKQTETESFRIEKMSVVQADDDLTIGVYSSKKGNDYVVGWLVCVEGADKGRDFRLYHGFNHIGRGSKCDVRLENDRQISNSTHCSIIYEGKKNEFYLIPEQGHLTYYEGKLLEKPVRLSSYDIFELGKSKLQFVAFCGGDRRWDM